ncbi:Uncharacterised protein [Burkholderia pseudomallei]|uniref:hypothetical protein n=1 Tax=Burkholderia pseudomallei TaxID=28450 RepID=UPI000F0DEBC1|nr:hypothetical protein [Burkholderia pseudomallei]VCC54069.1 Uncharacterised protein [Burkholderia pseudomallei]VCD11799.1 Uncharacterised protein [Burkholderia pseudomallei]
MACNSPSVQSVADKTLKAKEQIERLQSSLADTSKEACATFFRSIDDHFKSAYITDAREIGFNSAIKVEYTSEFSLDKIASVVTSSLQAISKATDPAVKNPAMSPDAISAYTDVVNKVAEAAKSSSTATASLSFSMNRLSPGLIAFLYATSTNIKDEETFGSEAVTATAIFYRFMQSIDDVKNQSAFGAAVIDARNYEQMKQLQAALTDSLAEGKIDIDTWSKLDLRYSEAIANIKKRLDDAKFRSERFAQAPAGAGLAGGLSGQLAFSQRLASAAAERLGSMGSQYRYVVEVIQSRLARGYF